MNGSGLTAMGTVDTDIEGYLQREYEKRIIESVEKIHKEVKFCVCVIGHTGFTTFKPANPQD